MHCTIIEAQQRLTYRQYRAHLAWLNKQWNEPNRSDHYLMQIARFILWTMKQDEGYDKLKIPFGPRDKDKKERVEEPSVRMTDQERNEIAKAVWMGRVGYKKKKK